MKRYVKRPILKRRRRVVNRDYVFITPVRFSKRRGPSDCETDTESPTIVRNYHPLTALQIRRKSTSATP